MSFSERFKAFVCEGDVIACEAEGFEIVARILRDDCPDPPDQRQDGFWPSYYIGDPGFIGPGKNYRQRFEEAQAKAEAIMAAWREGEWFYCGIVLSVAIDGIMLDQNAASLWGVEANYPGTDNDYLTDVAAELLPEAVEIGREAVLRLRCALEQRGARG
ncbi:MAG: hypothetical protein AB7F91_17365 [Parvularculaceae bacterium]